MTPVSRLMKVVLPAPLGPINAWRAPCSSLNDTLSVATRPPKRLTRPFVSRAIAMSYLPGRCLWQCLRPLDRAAGHTLPERPHPLRQALTAGEHNDDQDQADPELPIL